MLMKITYQAIFPFMQRAFEQEVKTLTERIHISDVCFKSTL